MQPTDPPTRQPAGAIDQSYVDAAGRTHTVAADVVAGLRQVIGREPGSGGPMVVRTGAEMGNGQVTLETGATVDVRGALPDEVGPGYHRWTDEAGERMLIVSPGQCYVPARPRTWGWATQLYASRSRRSWGCGDLADLERLGRWASGAGAGFVMVNPLHAAGPGIPQQASPYSPTSRRVRNPIYLDVDTVAAASVGAAALDDLATAARALNQERILDRDRVVQLKLDALHRVWASLADGRAGEGRGNGAGARAGDEAGTRSMRQIATWFALAEELGADWRRWPEAYRRPEGAAVAAFADQHTDRVRFHEWVQDLMTAQMDTVTSTVGVIQDLPIGFDAGGADAWCWQDLIAEGVSVGAPPDEFNTRGQDWGLPPFVPWKLRNAGYEPFIETVRATTSTGGGLRIDHVMGLFRLWWIPDGRGPADGAYVRYPADDLLDILALESHRSRALVIGEDLGTVEASVRAALAERRVLSYRLLWFEQEPPATWPAGAMGAITTHDLPTVTGLWDGSDLAEQVDLGMDPNAESTGEIRRRLGERAGLTDATTPGDVVVAAHDLLAQAPCALLCATLEDAFVEPRRPNIPGADAARANWSLALPRPIESLEDDEVAARIAASLAAAVNRGTAQITSQSASARGTNS